MAHRFKFAIIALVFASNAFAVTEEQVKDCSVKASIAMMIQDGRNQGMWDNPIKARDGVMEFFPEEGRNDPKLRTIVMEVGVIVFGHATRDFPAERMQDYAMQSCLDSKKPKKK